MKTRSSTSKDTRRSKRKFKSNSPNDSTLVCIYCERFFDNARGMTTHIRYCPRNPLIQNKRSKHGTMKTVFQEKVSTVTNVDVSNRRESFIIENNEGEDIQLRASDDNSRPMEGSLIVESVVHTNDAEVLELSTPSQLSLYNQHARFLQNSRNLVDEWKVDDMAKIDLLQTLNKHGCPNALYNDILKWTRHYSSQPGLTIFDNGSKFERRETFLKKLSKRCDLDGLQPVMKRLEVFGKFIDVTTYDFQQQLLSMLRDKELMKLENLMKLDDENEGMEYISEVQDASWYKMAKQFYDNEYGRDPSRLICGVILSIDKTHTDAKGKLCLEPVNFSLSLFNKKCRRKMKSAWRTLGFINDLNGNYLEEIWSQNEYFLGVTGKRSVPRSVKKSIIYHEILALVLESLQRVQDLGIVWNLPISNVRGNKSQVYHLVFPLCFGIFDMKGGKQLCGMYDANNVNRPCISCYSLLKDLDNSVKVCEPVREIELKGKILSTRNNSEVDDLKVISQYPNPQNAFFKLSTGGWPFGIWGLCPTEVLHQFYEGVVAYALQEFVENYLTSSSKKNIDRTLRQIVLAGTYQSDRGDYPKGSFSMGFTSLGKMKGIEKHSVLFYLCIFLHTECARTVKFGGMNIAKDNDLQLMKEWRKLFEKCLYYHDWLMQPSFERQSLESMNSRVIEFHKLLKKLIKRDGKGISGVPKFHEMLHIVRDIQRHGPAIMYDSCITEGHHHYQKLYAGRTQKRLTNFTAQTGNRLYEDQMISLTWNSIENIHPRFSFKTKKKINKTVHVRDGQRFKKGGPFYSYFDEVKKEVFFSGEKKKQMEFPNLSSYIDFNHKLRKFMKERVFLLTSKPFEEKVKCFSSIVKDDIIFKGLSRKNSEYPGWAEFQWSDNGNNDTYVVPGKIIMFVDFSEVNFKYCHENVYDKNELHVIIQSLQNSVIERRQVHSPLCMSVQVEEPTYDYRIVSIKTIFDACYVIPNFKGPDGEFESKSYLYIFPRNFQKRKDEESIIEKVNTTLRGWYNKF